MTPHPDPRIAVVAASLDILGGQGVQAHSLIEELGRDGHPVSFVAINPRFPRGLRWLRRLPYLRTMPSTRRCISRACCGWRAPTSSTCSRPRSGRSCSGRRRRCSWPGLLGKRVILHYHSGEAEEHLAGWGVLVHPWLRLAHQIVVPSGYLAGVFAHHGYDARAIRNVVDLSRFVYRERRPLRPALLSTRNLEPYYRVDVILAAFASRQGAVPEATLTVAGSGSEEEPAAPPGGRGRAVRGRR